MKDQEKEYAVHFAPDGKSVAVKGGTTILEASRAAGISLDAVCGGEGKCGRCKVRPKGRFSAARSPLVSEEESAAGIVLACKATVEGDLSVEVLPRSRVGRHQILTKSVEEIPRPLSPWVQKEFLHLPPATIWDNVADLERLWRALGRSGLPMPLEALRDLPEAVRTGDWKVTVTLSNVDSIDEITRVEPGDTTSQLLGIAVDIGTTTVVVDLVDLLTGEVLSTSSDYNRQVSRGEDVIARMIYSEEGGMEELNALVRDTINSLIAKLVQGDPSRGGRPLDPRDIVAISVAGNTIMTHFFTGLPTKHLRLEPYVPVAYHAGYPKAVELGLKANSSARALLFPSRAGYVGGDVVADVLASGMHLSDKLTLLIDVGTNGEIVLGRKDWMVSCSCSAGPAFEGGEVSCGMRAMDGAIDKIRINDDYSTSYHVLGEKRPIGICGSGLIDLVAEMYSRGIIDRKARVQKLSTERVRASDSGFEYVVERRKNLGEGTVSDLAVTDADLQNLLRTKAAIYGACSTLLKKMGETLDNVSSIVIAGGFGYHLDVGRAIWIGMFPDVPQEKYRFIGNGALGGARMALLSARKRKEMHDIFNKMTYLELSVDNDFYAEFSSSLFIPHTDISRFPSAPQERALKEDRA
ncbi:MAG: ASKHA domain-containing protein [Thermoplasmata archaeon]